MATTNILILRKYILGMNRKGQRAMEPAFTIIQCNRGREGPQRGQQDHVLLLCCGWQVQVSLSPLLGELVVTDSPAPFKASSTQQYAQIIL